MAASMEFGYQENEEARIQFKRNQGKSIKHSISTVQVSYFFLGLNSILIWLTWVSKKTFYFSVGWPSLVTMGRTGFGVQGENFSVIYLVCVCVWYVLGAYMWMTVWMGTPSEARASSITIHLSSSFSSSSSSSSPSPSPPPFSFFVSLFFLFFFFPPSFHLLLFFLLLLLLNQDLSM